MKKRTFIMISVVVVVGLVIAGSLYGYSHREIKGMHYTIAHEPCFAGTVKKVSAGKDKILVELFDLSGPLPWYADTSAVFDDPIYAVCSSVWVSLDVREPDGSYYPYVGDVVFVYYDGNIPDGDPAEITTVYAITIADRSGRQ